MSYRYQRQMIEEANYRNDYRVQARNQTRPYEVDGEAPGPVILRLDAYMVEDLLEQGHTIQASYCLRADVTVCEVCHGRGSHVNPSIDASGISGDDWDDWGPDEQDDYRNGAYDVACYGCKGLRVQADHCALVAALPKSIQVAIAEWYQDADDHAAEREAERRMGC